jgi:hypothetical protein
VSQGRGLGQLDEIHDAALDEMGEHTFMRRERWWGDERMNGLG